MVSGLRRVERTEPLNIGIEQPSKKAAGLECHSREVGETLDKNESGEAQ